MIIQSLMCHFELSFASIEASYGVDFASYFATELAALQEMAQSGLLRIEARRIVVLPPGRMLVSRDLDGLRLPPARRPRKQALFEGDLKNGMALVRTLARGRS